MQWRVEDGGNDHWYAISHAYGDYWQARDRAYERGGYLCTITNAAESSFVTAYIALHMNPGNPNAFWIGGRQDYPWNGPSNGWNWYGSYANEPWSFTNWAPGEPNDATNGEDYLQINQDNSGWNDRQWTVNALPLIEWDQESIATEDRTFSASRFAPAQPAPDGGEIVTFVFDGIPITSQHFSVRIRASADLGLPDECLFFRINGDSPWYQAVLSGESDCAWPASCGTDYVSDTIPHSGSMSIDVFATPGVSAKVCPDSFVEVALQYADQMDFDCNNNRIDDAYDILNGLLEDCNENFWADSCELAREPDRDCDGNGIPDCCDQLSGDFDCDRNGVLDRCDIAADSSLDCDGDGRLNLCELLIDGESDIDRNNSPDNCDILAGRLADCNHNDISDLVELADPANDVNGDTTLDACGNGTADLFVDGVVNAADLSIMLTLWGSDDPRGDLNRDDIVGAADLAIMLSSWGPVGLCGDGIANAGENCCNCPEDAGCGSGFDCYYGVCLPCPGGQCSPYGDDCDLLYGTAPWLKLGGYYGPCEREDVPLDCYSSLFDAPQGRGFSMNMLASDASDSSVMVASLSLLSLLAIPRSLLVRLKRRSHR